MFQLFRSSLAAVLITSATCAFAQEAVLFNGNDLDGWTFEPREGEDQIRPIEEVWVVQQGLLVSTGVTTGFLRHQREFEDYVLTLEWRSMRRETGLSIGGSGSVLVHTGQEIGSFHYPKSIEIAVFNDTGSVYMRDVEPFSEQQWAFRAPDFVDDVERDMGEWNQLKVICHGQRITVFVNGTPANQVDKLNRTKGTVALMSQRASFQAPSFYRNIKIQPLTGASQDEEAAAALKLNQFKSRVAAQRAAEEAARLGEERREKARAEQLSKQWATIDVSPDIEFSSDALQLPFPPNARDFELDPTFGDIEFVSQSSLNKLSKFYRTEMARGWTEVEKDRDEESIEVTFKHGEAEVELSLEERSDGVRVSLDCSGLTFEKARDPAALVEQGIPQPHAYLFLQQEFTLPKQVREIEYDGGTRCLFKCDLALQETFEFLCRQLRTKGYRETRRPIVNDNRRYTEFAKGPVELGINVFSHETGSRAVLTYEEN